MNYKVGVHFEEGVVLDIIAKDPEDAKKQAMQILDTWGGLDIPRLEKTVHRDFMVTDVELRPSE